MFGRETEKDEGGDEVGEAEHCSRLGPVFVDCPAAMGPRRR